jgi:hypothetical protein
MTDILSRLRDAHLLSRMELVALAGEAHGELVRLRKQAAVADNPYRFTVEVCSYLSPPPIWHLWLVVEGMEGGSTTALALPSFPTEAEANEHADMILTALQGATRELG